MIAQLLLAGLLAAAPVQEASGRTALTIAGQRVEADSRRHSGRLYLRLRDLRPVGLATTEEQGGRLRVVGPNGAVTLRIGSSLVRERGQMTLLSAPVRRWDGEWFVPEDFVDRVAVSILGSGRRVAAVTRVDRTRERGGVRVQVLRDRVEVRMRRSTPAEVSEQERWLTVRLGAGELSGRLPSVPYNGILPAMVAAPSGSAVELRLVKGPGFTHFETSTREGYQIVTLFGSNAGFSSVDAGAGVAAPAGDTFLPDRAPACSVVLDPGHGGADVGASAGGLAEKDLVLTFALAVRNRLQSRGQCVRLLRNRDVSLGLEQRTAAANHLHPRVVVSFHGTRTGLPAAYLHSSGAPEKKPEGLRKWERVQLDHSGASRQLGQLLLDGVRRATGRNGQLVAVPLTLLAPLDAPAVLLEIPLQSLRDSSQGPESLVDAVSDAIARFLATARRST